MQANKDNAADKSGGVISIQAEFGDFVPIFKAFDKFSYSDLMDQWFYRKNESIPERNITVFLLSVKKKKN